MSCVSSLPIKHDFEHNNGVSSVKVYGSNQSLLCLLLFSHISGGLR